MIYKDLNRFLFSLTPTLSQSSFSVNDVWENNGETKFQQSKIGVVSLKQKHCIYDVIPLLQLISSQNKSYLKRGSFYVSILKSIFNQYEKLCIIKALIDYYGRKKVVTKVSICVCKTFEWILETPIIIFRIKQRVIIE